MRFGLNAWLSREASYSRRMRVSRRILALVACAVLLGATAPPRRSYPPAPPGTVVDTYAGTTVTDPYRWLENPNDPAVRAWASAQSDLARRVVLTPHAGLSSYPRLGGVRGAARCHCTAA
ncbi:MAG: hypothetical protein JO103_10375, partial [Candidatus Eremiobacteraeota bacterium]|nr:hypothetical protein [Candidatus Eremiobacteraeota bacterium]